MGRAGIGRVRFKAVKAAVGVVLGLAGAPGDVLIPLGASGVLALAASVVFPVSHAFLLPVDVQDAELSATSPPVMCQRLDLLRGWAE